ncbi:MAG: hypothetical protein EXQ58_00050 [Acidobacteria bacterium]|nr:hypothetical protein [Acidobacteriota bacterium]
MLLQSHKPCPGDDRVRVIALLPALPPAWQNGSVSDLRARGGFEVDQTFEGGQIKEAVIKSALGGACAGETNTPVLITAKGQVVPYVKISETIIRFHTAPGGRYVLKAI